MAARSLTHRTPLRSLPVAFYRRPCEEVARDLLGRYLVRRIEAGSPVVGRIVETEAYLGEGDRASHAWHGRVTPRNATLFRRGGCAYVYLIYGIYDCFNAVTGDAGEGTAVLIRAIEPVTGEDAMASARGFTSAVRPGDIGGGPGKLCRALSIDRGFDGTPLKSRALAIAEGEPVEKSEVASGPRIGIDYAGEAAEWPLRFAVSGNPHVSKPGL